MYFVALFTSAWIEMENVRDIIVVCYRRALHERVD